MGRQMMLSELTLNPSVKPEDERRLSRQALRIYTALQKGPVWTNTLVSLARQYNARIHELRQWLAPQGLTIDLTGKDVQGDFKYELVDSADSRYEQTLKKKGKL